MPLYHIITHNVSTEQLFPLEMETLNFTFSIKIKLLQNISTYTFSKTLRDIDHVVCWRNPLKNPPVKVILRFDKKKSYSFFLIMLNVLFEMAYFGKFIVGFVMYNME